MSSAAVRLSFYIDKKVCKFFENFVNIFCRNSIFLLYCSKINLISETAMAGQVQPFPVRALPFMLKYAGIFRRPIIVSFALVLLAAMFSNLNDWLFAEIIASVRHLNTQDGFAQGVKDILYLSVCAGTTAWLTRFRNIYDTKNLYTPLHIKIFADSYNYLLGHSYGYIINTQTGSFLQKIQQLIRIRFMLQGFINGIWRPVAEIVVKTIILLGIHPLLGGGFFLCTVLVLLPGSAFDKEIKRKSKLAAVAGALVNGWITDILSNLSLVRLFDRLSFEQKRLRPILGQEYLTRCLSTKAWFNQHLLIGLTITLLSFALLVLTVWLWSRNELSLAEMIFVLTSVISGLTWMNDLHVFLQDIQAGCSEVEKMLEPFARPWDIVDAENAKKLRIRQGGIEFRNVEFAYNGQKAVFQNLNLKIAPGEKVGLVGVSGSGKSTLLNLLLRAYDVNAGEILIDGQNISRVSQESLHQNIGVIPQDTSLFHRSIADNIAYGKPNAGFKEIIQAAEDACADAFIREKAEGYQARVGDKGVKLSGGERQRIAIARAILKDAPILILDEATSSLDSETEAQIQQGISRLIQNKTVVAVAHRLSTLKAMDRIVVLDKGRIIEEGTPDELIKKGGKYAKLWKLQQSNAEK